MNDAEDYITKLLQELDCKGVKPYATGDIHCQCPFHRPSSNITAFGISFTKEDDGYPFNCLSCGESGNLSKLVSFAYDCSYERANKLITKNIALSPITVKRLNAEFTKLKELRKAHEWASKQVRMPVRAGNQKAMIRYLDKRKKRGRGVLNVPYIVNRYKLYYCGDGRMAGRIIMPIHIGGKIVGINDRAVDESVRNKSLHIKGQEYSELMHGIDEAQGKPIVVIVEGAFDMFQCASALAKESRLNTRYGFINNMGTSISDTKVSLIIEHFEEAVIMFDNQVNDRGVNDGFDGSVKWYRQLRDYMPCRNITTSYPQGKDPGICTKEQIIDAIKSKGYIPKSSLQRLKDGTTIKL